MLLCSVSPPSCANVAVLRIAAELCQCCCVTYQLCQRCCVTYRLPTLCLSQVWNLIGLVGDPGLVGSNADPDVGRPWAQHPFGRRLVESV